MAIYEISSNQFRKIDETSFSSEDLQERRDLQRLLRCQIEIVSPDTLVIAEEFSQWEDSNRRIDLLAIDKNANLVVIELKCTKDGGQMELQSIRYAAMVSVMTFERAVEVFAEFLRKLERSDDARSLILDFLEWDEPDEDRFAQDVRIVLVSADFSKELTTSVIWLNERGLDIECVRIKPYRDNGRLLADIQQVIPLPEAEDFRVRMKDKQQKERAARRNVKSFVRYDVSVGDQTFERLARNAAIFRIVQYLIEHGHAPERIAELISWKRILFYAQEGVLDSEHFCLKAMQIEESGGKKFFPKCYFLKDEELLHANEKTYAFINDWGPRTAEAMKLLVEAFPEEPISFQESQ